MSYLTTPFWVDKSSEKTFGTQNFTGDGILYNIPYRDPVQTGFVFGDGNQNVFGDNKLVFSTQPETFAVGNILPTVAGKPRIDPNAWQNTFSREKVTVRI